MRGGLQNVVSRTTGVSSDAVQVLVSCARVVGAGSCDNRPICDQGSFLLHITQQERERTPDHRLTTVLLGSEWHIRYEGASVME